MASAKPSIQGLNAALAPNVDDPLGTNLKRRGLDAYNEEARKSDPNYMSGPLPDPAWEGLFQALADNHVTKVGQDAARPEGIASDPSQPGWAPPATDLNGLTEQDLLNKRTMRSNNLATPGTYSRR